MKKYDFDRITERRGTSCIKYDAGPQRKGRDDLLPLWVADMDFPLPEEILAEFRRRIDHGIFGYTDPDAAYYEAINRWFGTRHGYTVQPEWVTVGCGIVYGIHTAVRAFTESGDAILITQPVYYPFSEAIETNGRRLVNSQLHFEDGRYTIDFEDFEKKIRDNSVKLFILCNPHNPVGRVWRRDELERIAEICIRHDVILLSDEIHCDFIYPGRRFTSCMTLDERIRSRLILCTSPSKSFNVAGFQPANIIIPDAGLRAKYRRANDAAGYSNGSVMGQTAVKVCYTLGGEWHDALMDYLTDNMRYMQHFVKEHLPQARFVEPEGTYLTWVDFSGYGFTDDELEHLIVEEAHLWLDSGRIFGKETAQFERFNIACPRSILIQCMTQLKEALDNHRKW